MATIQGGTRIAELANGELVVGTKDGDVVLVSTFGDVRTIARVGAGPVVDLIGEPSGGYWVRVADGTVYEATPWTSPKPVGTADLLFRSCEATELLQTVELPPGATTMALGADCGSRHVGDAEGRIDGRKVSDRPIRRLMELDDGVLWVDDSNVLGCLDCAAPMNAQGTVDAVQMHLRPFVPGEILILDTAGSLRVRLP